MKQTGDFLKMKQTGEALCMVTAYDYPSALQAESANVDMILVGDSLGMVVLGYDSTIPVTVGDMIHHTKAVRRGAKNTYIVTDMPFMSYHASIEDTIHTARKMIQESGANALKLEGSGDIIFTIEKLTHAGVPVVGHLGLTPQSVGVLGGYKVQGKDLESAKKLIEDAKKIEAAGAVALVLECVPKQLGALVTSELSIPVIGIGAGKDTDGQVLVYHDILAYGSSFVPKFVKQYVNINDPIQTGLNSYVQEVKQREFPTEAHTFSMKEEDLSGLYGGKPS